MGFVGWISFRPLSRAVSSNDAVVFNVRPGIGHLSSSPFSGTFSDPVLRVQMPPCNYRPGRNGSGGLCESGCITAIAHASCFWVQECRSLGMELRGAGLLGLPLQRYMGR